MISKETAMKTTDGITSEEKSLTKPVDQKIQHIEETKGIAENEDHLLHESHLKIAIIGNVDSGKSTLVGVLTKGLFDDGRGAARSRVFNYRHEAENGRTSSIAQEIMGFNEKGEQVLPDRFNPNKNKYWAEVVKKSSKIVTMVDLCGHEKYLKTTMFGLTGLVPDYTMIIVGANMGLSRMTKEHLGITLALKIPFFVVLTKIDMCPETKFTETLDTLLTLLKHDNVKRRPIQIKSSDDIKICAEGIASNCICPIFTCSSVTGEGVPELVSFISMINNRDKTNKLLRTPKDPIQFDINENFLVSGVGIVVSGLVKSGTIKLNSQVLLGPDRANTFKPVVVKSIHVNRVPAEEAIAGEFACLAIRPTNKKETLSRDEFRKGMVILDGGSKPESIWEFDAEVLILHHATTVQPNYQAVGHCGVIRQAVKIVGMAKELMRTGDKGQVRFRFMYNSEYLRPGYPLLLREGRTKILGLVSKVYPGTTNEEQLLLKPTVTEKKSKEISKETVTNKQEVPIKQEIKVSKQEVVK